MEEIEEESLHITKLVNIDGEALRANVAIIDEETLINDDPFDAASTDEEDYEAGEVTKYYRTSVSSLANNCRHSEG